MDQNGIVGYDYIFIEPSNRQSYYNFSKYFPSMWGFLMLLISIAHLTKSKIILQK